MGHKNTLDLIRVDHSHTPNNSVNLEIIVRILFLRIALKDVKIRD